jgi:hypothetical protein
MGEIIIEISLSIYKVVHLKSARIIKSPYIYKYIDLNKEASRFYT